MDETHFWIETQFISDRMTPAEIIDDLKRAGYPVEKKRPMGQNRLWVLRPDNTLTATEAHGIKLISPVMDSAVGFYEVHCLLRSLNECDGIGLNAKCRLSVHIGYASSIYHIEAAENYLQHPINALIDAFELYELSQQYDKGKGAKLL